MSTPLETVAVAPERQAAPFRVLVVGNRGMLAQDLLRSLQQGGVSAVGLGRPAIDITQLRPLLAAIQGVAPNLVVNCAAYTAVDKAEAEPERAFAVNRDGCLHLAKVCRQLSIPLLAISTDYVFDGKTRHPYREDAPAHPLGVYGHSKWAGEKVIRTHLEQHFIVRTSWLYGSGGHNFVKTILDLARQREEISVVADQYGCPTWTGDLADALSRLVRRVRDDRSRIQWGTYHFCGAGQTTWCGFAEAIIHYGRRQESLKVLQVKPISTDQYPVAARRPSFSVLDCTKIQQAFQITPRPWLAGLHDMLAELYSRTDLS